jgi:hypothetical protein
MSFMKLRPREPAGDGERVNDELSAISFQLSARLESGAILLTADA